MHGPGSTPALGGIVLAGAALLMSSLPSPAPAGEPLAAAQVYVALSQRTEPGARADYLRLHAGLPVTGSGHLEAVLPRAYYDTSVPHHNSAVALIQVDSGRKVVCGLPKVTTPDRLGQLTEGLRVAFRGVLADAQDWGAWSSLYLADCALEKAP
ncbi:MAG: hypothetical protein ACYDA8_00560 [Deferrisomatales bacterium]